MLKRKLNLIPDVGGIARDLTDKTQIQIVLDKFMKLNSLNKIIFVFNNITFLPDLIRKDFATGIKILCELEILKSTSKEFVLHNQIVDMTVALNNERILLNYFYLSKKYNFIPVLKTYNPGYLINFLSAFDFIPPKLFLYVPETSIKQFNLDNLFGNTNLVLKSFSND